MVLYSQRKYRSSSSHFSLASLSLLFNPFNKIQFATSIYLFVRGCSTDVKRCLTFKSSGSFFKCLFVNCVSLSLMTYWGTPYLSKIILLKNFSMSVGVIFDKASTSIHFVKYLTAMKMNFNWPGPEENGQIMSIPHYVKVQGNVNMFNSDGGSLQISLCFWHCSYFFTSPLESYTIDVHGSEVLPIYSLMHLGNGECDLLSFKEFGQGVDNNLLYKTLPNTECEPSLLFRRQDFVRLADDTSWVSILGLPRVSYIKEWFINKVLVLTGLDNTSTLVFFSLGDTMISCDLIFAIFSLVKLTYRCSNGSLVCDSPLILYLAWLLVVSNSKHKYTMITRPTSFSNMRLTLLPLLFDDLFMSTI